MKPFHVVCGNCGLLHLFVAVLLRNVVAANALLRCPMCGEELPLPDIDYLDGVIAAHTPSPVAPFPS